MFFATLTIAVVAVGVGVYLTTLETDAFQLELPLLASFRHSPLLLTTTMTKSGDVDHTTIHAWKKNVAGPESFVFDDADNLYAGLSDGRVVRIGGGTVRGETRFSARGESVETLAYTGDPNKVAPLPCTEYKTVPGDLEPMCGRPLGMAFDSTHRRLVVIDAYLGLMDMAVAKADGSDGGDAGADAKMTPLTTSVAGKRIVFGNAVVVSADGQRIYFTSSSSQFSRAQFAQAVLAQDKTGRVLCYDRSNKQTTVLADGIAFANGLVFADASESALLVVATNEFAIVRVPLAARDTSPAKTQTSVWASNLPCIPDNVHWNNDNARRHLILGCYTTRASDYGATLLFSLLARPTLRQWMTRLERVWPGAVSALVRVTSIVVVLDGGSGDVAFVATDRDSSGSAARQLAFAAPISAAVHHRGTLYVGSVVGTVIPRVPWNLAERLAAAK